MKRPPIIRAWQDGLIADSFAGGGGASSGIEAALGRSPDIAVNHDPEAIAMHRANHPSTKHYIESVWKIDPVIACGGKPVALAWFSPDCKHHSKAKGGKPREQKIRGLAWVAVRWAAAVKPCVIALENVEEFQDWGPLDTDGNPIKPRRGQTFRAFVRKLERLGYVVEHRLLRACDFGAPTTRRRLFLVARCDGRAIVWPTPSHGPTRAKAHRTAAECIDWDLPCPSIFDRDRELADKTLARIARGVRKYVLESARPFILPVSHGGIGRDDRRVHSVDEPLRTITSHGRGSHAIAVPYLVHRSNGERVGQAPRIYDIQRPLGTIMGQGEKHALVAAFLAKHYGGHESTTGGKQLTVPFDTVTSIDHHSLVAAHLVKHYGTSTGHAVDEPLRTVTAGGWKHGLVSAFLARYNGTGQAESLQLPLGTVTTRDRFALVTVTIDGEEYVVVDIGMRMLSPRELFRAQGFPDWSIVLTGEGWRDRTIPEEDGRRTSARCVTARVVSSSSPESEPASNSRAVVHARIDLGRNVLELRSLERSESPASNAPPLFSCPLPAHIADSARRLAPTHSCGDQTATPGKAALASESSSPSISQRRGKRSAKSSGAVTTESASGAARRSNGETGPRDTPSTTSAAGLNSQTSDSIAETLFCFVRHAIAGSTLAQTLTTDTFDIQLEVRNQYDITPQYNGKQLTKTAQIRMCGNSVAPPVAAAVIRAQFGLEGA